MLKSFPEQALAYAVDGVIAPSALGQAARADQLLASARRRATALLDGVPAQVEQATAQAHRDGFHAGYAEAVALAVPMLGAALADVQALRDTVLGHIRSVITASLAAEGVDAQLVVRRCEQALGAGETAMVLHVPAHMGPLQQAVQAQLTQCEPVPPLQITAAESALPMLRLGPMVFELDPAGATTRAVENQVDADALETAARARASAYLAAVNARLKRLPFPDLTLGADA